MPLTHPKETDEDTPAIDNRAGDAPSDENGHEAIARLAYAIWQEHGCPQGTDVEDWLEAEQKLARRQVASTA